MSKTNLIYVHTGNNIPEYIFDSIFQTLLVSPNTKIYIVLEDDVIPYFKMVIQQFNINDYFTEPIDLDNIIEFVRMSYLYTPIEFIDFVCKIPEGRAQFRNNFWIHTTYRFFCIEACMTLYKLSNTYHIENDNMLFFDLNRLNLENDKTYMVRDSPVRVIPSILYFSNLRQIQKLNKHILSILNSTSNYIINDMVLLGSYKDDDVIYFPYKFESDSPFIMDAAAIGQYLGGIDPRNTENFNEKSELEKRLVVFDNPSKNFINNETDFNPSTLLYGVHKVQLKHLNIPIELYIAVSDDERIKNIMNLHIHSKQLYQFSSINNLKLNDMISPDTVMRRCFFDGKNSIFVKSFEEFVSNVMSTLPDDLSYNLYSYDKMDTKTFEILNNNKNVISVYSQNIQPPKFKYLPIGLSNNIEQLLELYETRANIYLLNKQADLYIGFDTYQRNNIRLKQPYKVSSKKNYKDYLQELSVHRFSLCSSENIFECLYLGVIPVLVNNKDKVLIEYLRSSEIPFYEFNDNLEYFTEDIYKSTKNIYNIDALTLGYYF